MFFLQCCAINYSVRPQHTLHFFCSEQAFHTSSAGHALGQRVMLSKTLRKGTLSCWLYLMKSQTLFSSYTVALSLLFQKQYLWKLSHLADCSVECLAAWKRLLFTLVLVGKEPCTTLVIHGFIMLSRIFLCANRYILFSLGSPGTKIFPYYKPSISAS